MTTIRHFISLLLENSIDTAPFHLITYPEESGIGSAVFQRGIFDMGEPTYEEMLEGMIGICDVYPPTESCNDAWYVGAIAGPGGIVYDLGYYLSPTGKLMSDREMVSASAVAAWTRWGRKGEGEPLDDIENPRNNNPNDDCLVWQGAPDGRIKNMNYQYRDILPTASADAMNKSYKKTPKYDWGRMKHETQKITASFSDDFLINVEDVATRFFKRTQ